MKSIVECAHDFLEDVLHPQAVCIDATLGRGNDTRFFLSHGVQAVYAFEIQTDLCRQARDAIPDPALHIMQTGHEHMEEVLPFAPENVDAIVFNFGWDPRRPDTLCTCHETSLEAVRQACRLLRPRGRMALVLYPHAEGRREEETIAEYFSRQSDFEVMAVSMPYKESPKALLVEKRKRKGSSAHDSTR